MRMNTQIDVRDVLPAIQAPTLVLHRADDRTRRGGRSLDRRADPGRDSSSSPGWRTSSGRRHRRDRRRDRGVPDRRASRCPSPTGCSRPCCSRTSSTRPSRPRELGDRRWRDLLERASRARARDELERFRGREVDTAGDGFFATFDGPARAIRCALGDRRRGFVRSGSRSAPGVHTGECELVGGKVAGIAVHIGRPCREPGGAGRGARLVDRQGPRRGLGDRVRGPRHARAEGRPRRVAALRGEVTGPGANLPALSVSIRRRRC